MSRTAPVPLFTQAWKVPSASGIDASAGPAETASTAPAANATRRMRPPRKARMKTPPPLLSSRQSPGGARTFHLGARHSPSCGVELAPERVREHEVDERALAVDLDDREPLAVARLELRVARDVDLAQLERPPDAHLADDGARPLAEVAALRVVERDDRAQG